MGDHPRKAAGQSIANLIRLDVDCPVVLLQPKSPHLPRSPKYQPQALPAWKGGVIIYEDNRKPSPRQRHVIQLVAKGLKNREIANKLGIGEHVVRNYLSIIYDKVGVSNRVELALWYEARLHERRFRRTR
jgi:DNA-binding NarL/FixJ family response regulator